MYAVATNTDNVGPFKTVRAAKLWLKQFDADAKPELCIFELADPEMYLWAEKASNGTITTGISESSPKPTEPNSQNSATTSIEKRSKT